jgi:hypothetical protein
MIVSNFGLFIYFRSTFVLTHVLRDMKNLKCCGFFVFVYYIWNYIINGDEIYFVSEINISG